MEIDHFNPKSKNYIPDHRTEKTVHDSVEDYNSVIKNIKRDLEMQKSVMDYIKNMKKPYLKGLKGSEQNVYENV